MAVATHNGSGTTGNENNTHTHSQLPAQSTAHIPAAAATARWKRLADRHGKHHHTHTFQFHDRLTR